MDLSGNMRARRLELELSLEELAERCGVSRAMLSDVERGLKNPSIRVVCQIAEALGCSVSQLIGETTQATSEGSQVLRRTERQVLIDARSGVARHLLSPGLVRRGIELVWYSIPPGESTGVFPPHQPGTEENITVVEGILECKLQEEIVTLSADDSIFFQADVPHEFRNVGSEVCHYFLVIASSARPSLKIHHTETEKPGKLKNEES